MMSETNVFNLSALRLVAFSVQDMALVANHPHVDVNGFIVNLPYLARWTFPSHTLIELVRFGKRV